jgi:DNA-binding transcriptional MocR family regulator
VATLRERIESGEIPPDGALPSITYLVQETGLAVGTSRLALMQRTASEQLTAVGSRLHRRRTAEPEPTLAAILAFAVGGTHIRPLDTPGARR